MIKQVIIVSACLFGCAADPASTGEGPAAPSQLTAAVLSGGAHLTWKDNSSDEAHFMVERMVHGQGDFEEVTTVPFNTTQYHDTGVVAGTQYMYRVTAMNDAGEAPSNEITFSMP